MSLIHDKHMMVDFETLGTTPDSFILSVGAAVFVPSENQIIKYPIYRTLSSVGQKDRKIDPKTVAWWMNQPIKPPMNGTYDLYTALYDLCKTYQEYGCSHLWANGTDFDIPLMHHAMNSFSIATPWKYSDVKDYRTLRKLLPHIPRPENPSLHNAYEDAKSQALHTSALLVHLDGMVKTWDKE